MFNALRQAFPALLFLVILFSSVQAQNIGGVVNTYTRVINFPTCANQLTVSSSAGFSPGDTVLIIQMRGATVDQTNGNGTTQYGDVSSYDQAGNYETGIIRDIVGLNIYLEKELVRTYNVGGDVQMILIPQYDNPVVTSTLTAMPWNGSVGGVLIIQVKGTLTMNADIDVSGLGFRGGAKSVNGCTTCFQFPQSMAYNGPVTEAAQKGEGIVYLEFESAGQGKWANGGGGGNCHNAGGGGGSNAGIGGQGGDKSSTCGFLATNGPGRGGATMLYNNAQNKVFMGGGGGGGHQNNLVGGGPPAQTGGTDGGNGGGIVILIANSISGNGNTIRSNGSTVPVSGFEDGAGGGGAGGVILLEANTFTSALNVIANGGKGGDTRAFGPNMRDLGPGGGGGGGLLWVSGGAVDPNITVSVMRGLNGTSAYCGCVYGSTPGGNGATLTGLIVPEGTLDPGPGCVLPVEMTAFEAYQHSGTIRLNWTTATELNNDHFEVERNTDGTGDFYPLGRVSGAGTSLSPQTYSFEDDHPRYGLNYYKLIQTDLDGTRYYAGMVAVQYAPSLESGARVFPNPVKPGERLTVELPAAGLQNLQYRIQDLLGRTLKTGMLSLADGENRMFIPTDGLSEGNYFLSWSAGEPWESVKIAIVR
jgi:hypothetical protein